MMPSVNLEAHPQQTKTGIARYVFLCHLETGVVSCLPSKNGGANSGYHSHRDLELLGTVPDHHRREKRWSENNKTQNIKNARLARPLRYGGGAMPLKESEAYKANFIEGHGGGEDECKTCNTTI